MARVALEIPKVGLVMEQARLVRWLKNPGDFVAQGEPVLELETEKSVVEIEATVSGRLVEQLVKVDEEAKVGDRVAWLETDAASSAATHPTAATSRESEASAHAAAPAAGSAEASASGTSAGGAVPRASHPTGALGSVASAGASHVSSPSVTSHASSPSPTSPARDVSRSAGPPGASASANGHGDGRVRSSPVARRLAAQSGIDIGTVVGTGPRGRVQLEDVRRAIQARSLQTGANGAASAPQPLSSMRRALARAMTLSNATVPQFAVERSVDWTAVQAARARFASDSRAGSPKLSVNDFLLQAIARALLSYPALNATFRGDPESPDAAIVPAVGAHIGLVVAVDNGLLVPVLHDVERLGLAELARRRSEVVERALQGRLKQAELEGATFSLSNLGARGPDRFNALINPPQSAILAVGRQREGVVVLNGGIHVRPLSTLSVTVDHRVADGRLAAEFLAYLVEILEGDDWRV
ncbi:MAG TPA: dihydrolipoamide acetyltransferase family protein [Steroidobacteraceae bacterium]|nr:dihydrolipoamide acetyltransferase family protein [Steroidobacteraceae bacterium]